MLQKTSGKKQTVRFCCKTVRFVWVLGGSRYCSFPRLKFLASSCQIDACDHFFIFCFLFFPSGLADVALRLGPNMSISKTNIQFVHGLNWSHAIWQIKHKPETPTTRPRRPANPPARFAFRQKDSKPDKKRGRSPNTTPTNKKISMHVINWCLKLIDQSTSRWLMLPNVKRICALIDIVTLWVTPKSKSTSSGAEWGKHSEYPLVNQHSNGKLP